MVRSRRSAVPGITVYQRGRKWYYRLELGKDPLTGDRLRENGSGFDTDDDAWTEALESKARHDKGRNVAPSKRTVAEYLTLWLDEIKPYVKPSTHQNYCDYVTFYVNPVIGGLKLQKETGTGVLNRFYLRLAESGRLRKDTNWDLYEYWRVRQDQRGGLGPLPREMARACGVGVPGAQKAARRFRAGRIPEAPMDPGLAPKTLRNIHQMLNRAFDDAVSWDYMMSNPAEKARLPRVARHRRRKRPTPWTVAELAAWLVVALVDRFAALWMLAATTGMRRSELAGVEIDDVVLWKRCCACGATYSTEDDQCEPCGGPNLEFRGKVAIGPTRVVVGGRVQASDGKTDAAERVVALDPVTAGLLYAYLKVLRGERAAFGSAYPFHRKLMAMPDGRLPHPDTITVWFNRLVDRAGVRRIRLQDVRHSFATIARDAGINGKIISDRLGHANENVTRQIYQHRSTGLDGPAADMIARLIAAAIEDARRTD